MAAGISKLASGKFTLYRIECLRNGLMKLTQIRRGINFFSILQKCHV